MFVVGSVTVAFPVGATVTFLPLFAPSTAVLIFAISSGLNCDGFATGVLAGVTGVKSLATSAADRFTGFAAMAWTPL